MAVALPQGVGFVEIEDHDSVRCKSVPFLTSSKNLKRISCECNTTAVQGIPSDEIMLSTSVVMLLEG